MTFDATKATPVPAIDHSTAVRTTAIRVAPDCTISSGSGTSAHESTMAAKLDAASKTVRVGMLGTIMAREMLTCVMARSAV